jgi:response regulator of citrate/malate metabolism
VSALALPEVRRSFLQQGALDYLFKPFSNRTFEQIRGLIMERFPQLDGISAVQRPALNLPPQLPVT